MNPWFNCSVSYENVGFENFIFKKVHHLSYLNHLYLRHSQSKSPKIQEKREEQWSQRRWHHRKPLKTSKPVGIGRMERNASVKYALVGKLRDFWIATLFSEPYSWGSRKVLTSFEVLKDKQTKLYFWKNFIQWKFLFNKIFHHVQKPLYGTINEGMWV